MSDSLSNKELVAVGHHLAKALSSDTPIMDIAKIVSRLAERLDCTTAALHATRAQRDQLGAENGKMLRLLTDISENHLEYLSEGEDCMMAGVPLDYVSEINTYVSRDVNAENPFKQTDAFLAEVRAQGAEGFIDFCGEENSVFVESKAYYRSLSDAVAEFAEQLRLGASQ
ncbi:MULTISPECIES: hypothetical protein [unclassified Leclercia]|uniref:hypothetical protein n=1 Tax=unclassified Leclercia TaxID=2627398 RepID=UPI000CD0A8E5|nr:MULTISPECIES: hypothetical protein [unclassified Leclercia]AUU85387.1 hypothetical protein C2U54_15775 [Leclercia sp. LSNIH1]POV33992.1 hypothetical protein C3388_12015 [Leclercia sp. LSNIH5]POW66418.1 hypothetical protein C3389_09005 [Leclercia sp. LSNIH2]UGB01839.1 hypothetical protein LRS40_19580 [Leclercia sp. G3L]